MCCWRDKGFELRSEYSRVLAPILRAPFHPAAPAPNLNTAPTSPTPGASHPPAAGCGGFSPHFVHLENRGAEQVWGREVGAESLQGVSSSSQMAHYLQETGSFARTIRKRITPSTTLPPIKSALLIPHRPSNPSLSSPGEESLGSQGPWVADLLLSISQRSLTP